MRMLRLSLIGLALLILVTTPLTAQRIRVYDGPDFDGASETFESAVRALPGNWNDRISSVRVEGAWELCDGANFRDCVRIDDDTSDLSRIRLDDRVSSLRPVGDDDDDDNWAGGGTGGRNSITVYDGSSETFESDVRALPGNWNDRISSVRVEGTWELCDGSNFQDCTTVDRDAPDLGRMRLNDRVSSLRSVEDDDDWAGGGSGARNSITVYDGRDYDGSSETFESDVRALPGNWNDRISSVRVDGSWELCAGADFRDCVTVDRDVSDLSRMRLDDAVSSLRPRD